MTYKAAIGYVSKLLCEIHALYIDHASDGNFCKIYSVPILSPFHVFG